MEAINNAATFAELMKSTNKVIDIVTEQASKTQYAGNSKIVRSAADYINDIRTETAAELLCDTNASLRETTERLTGKAKTSIRVIRQCKFEIILVFDQACHKSTHSPKDKPHFVRYNTLIRRIL